MTGISQQVPMDINVAPNASAVVLRLVISSFSKMTKKDDNSANQRHEKIKNPLLGISTPRPQVLAFALVLPRLGGRRRSRTTTTTTATPRFASGIVVRAGTILFCALSCITITKKKKLQLSALVLRFPPSDSRCPRVIID